LDPSGCYQGSNQSQSAIGRQCAASTSIYKYIS
jgi:hypothetical protein